MEQQVKQALLNTELSSNQVWKQVPVSWLDAVEDKIWQQYRDEIEKSSAIICKVQDIVWDVSTIINLIKQEISLVASGDNPNCSPESIEVKILQYLQQSTKSGGKENGNNDVLQAVESTMKKLRAYSKQLHKEGQEKAEVVTSIIGILCNTMREIKQEIGISIRDCPNEFVVVDEINCYYLKTALELIDLENTKKCNILKYLKNLYYSLKDICDEKIENCLLSYQSEIVSQHSESGENMHDKYKSCGNMIEGFFAEYRLNLLAMRAKGFECDLDLLKQSLPNQSEKSIRVSAVLPNNSNGDGQQLVANILQGHVRDIWLADDRRDTVQHQRQTNTQTKLIDTSIYLDCNGRTDENENPEAWLPNHHTRFLQSLVGHNQERRGSSADNCNYQPEINLNTNNTWQDINLFSEQNMNSEYPLDWSAFNGSYDPFAAMNSENFKSQYNNGSPWEYCENSFNADNYNVIYGANSCNKNRWDNGHFSPSKRRAHGFHRKQNKKSSQKAAPEFHFVPSEFPGLNQQSEAPCTTGSNVVVTTATSHGGTTTQSYYQTKKAPALDVHAKAFVSRMSPVFCRPVFTPPMPVYPRPAPVPTTTGHNYVPFFTNQLPNTSQFWQSQNRFLLPPPPPTPPRFPQQIVYQNQPFFHMPVYPVIHGSNLVNIAPFNSPQMC